MTASSKLINRLIDEDANRRAQRMVNRAGFETNQEAADRMHEEELRMHERRSGWPGPAQRPVLHRGAGRDDGGPGRAPTTTTPTSEAPARSETER